MLKVMQLHELPPVPEGYLRVIRGERPDRPKSPVPYAPDWSGLPCPHDDGVEGSYISMNCAAYMHTLHEWWPEDARVKAMEYYDMHFIVLDVPEQYCRKGHKQALIMRDCAVPVALIH